MIIWGKVIGATIGFILYGPVGIVAGLVFGQVFDNGLHAIMYAPQHSAEARTVFFKCVFQTMGYLAKLDGVVSQNDINIARDIMRNDFTLTDEQTVLAMQYFNQGKTAQFDLHSAMGEFKSVCGAYRDLTRFFLELQVKAVMVDNVMHEAAHGRLVYICSALNIPLSELDYLLRAYGFSYQQNYSYQQSANFQGYSNYQQSGQQEYSANNANYSRVREEPLTQAYNLLGVDAQASTKAVKTAYRKLVSKYHPDKLVAKGLPPEMMRVAKEKTQKLNDAYALIMRSRE